MLLHPTEPGITLCPDHRFQRKPGLGHHKPGPLLCNKKVPARHRKFFNQGFLKQIVVLVEGLMITGAKFIKPDPMPVLFGKNPSRLPSGGLIGVDNNGLWIE